MEATGAVRGSAHTEGLAAGPDDATRAERFSVVDIHSHWYPASYLARLRARTAPPLLRSTPEGDRFVIFAGEQGRVIDDRFWDLSRKLRYMDESGISHSIVSLGNPWLDPFEAEGRGIADELNGLLAALNGATGGRLFGLGVLPSSTVADVLAVIGDIGTRAGLVGVMSGTRVAGHALDDPALEPVWGALQSAGLPVFLHPHYCFGQEELGGHGYVLPIGLGFPFETTVAVARLVLSGVLQRFPGLELVAAHGGGALPFLAGRLDVVWAVDPRARQRLTVAPSLQLRRVFLDGLVYGPAALAAAAALVGADRLGVGTDHPFGIGDPKQIIGAVRAAFPAADQDNVLAANAVRFFGLERRPG